MEDTGTNNRNIVHRRNSSGGAADDLVYCPDHLWTKALMLPTVQSVGSSRSQLIPLPDLFLAEEMHLPNVAPPPQG